jgi:hypothetical protein
VELTQTLDDLREYRDLHQMLAEAASAWLYVPRADVVVGDPIFKLFRYEPTGPDADRDGDLVLKVAFLRNGRVRVDLFVIHEGTPGQMWQAEAPLVRIGELAEQCGVQA